MSAVSNEAVEELAFQWTGKRIPYAKISPHFVARIRQIVEPAQDLLQYPDRPYADRFAALATTEEGEE